MNLDTDGMDDKMAGFVKRCYVPGYEENMARCEKEKWWEGIGNKIEPCVGREEIVND